MTGPKRWRLADALRRRFHAVAQRPRATMPWGARSSHTSGPAGDDHVWSVRLALPGIAPENVNVNVAGRRLYVRAVEQDGGAHIRYYDQLIAVPAFVDPEGVVARYRHGLLELRLPYKQAVKPRRIEVATYEHRELQAA